MPQDNDSSGERFSSLLKRLVRVPKREIDAQDEKFKKKRAADEYKGQRRPVVPTPRSRA